MAAIKVSQFDFLLKVNNKQYRSMFFLTSVNKNHL